MIDNKSGHSMVDVQVQLNKYLIIYGVELSVWLNKRPVRLLFCAASKNYTQNIIRNVTGMICKNSMRLLLSTG